MLRQVSWRFPPSEIEIAHNLGSRTHDLSSRTHDRAKVLQQAHDVQIS